jgi:bifunctional DNA-binding transcriptional regulator/antitoxin component of YhaV-PrlF toxin-antitoxin module
VPTEFKVSVNTRGTIVIPKEAVADAFRFAPGQSFVARRRGTKIVLTLSR